MPAFNFAEFVGSPDDPHRQTRAARQQPLLLHSMALFREVFELIFANRTILTVIEVGVESGGVSSAYVELGATNVYCVEPKPTEDLRLTLSSDSMHLVEMYSPAALTELPIADLYVLDGDHNYAVVRQEVMWILQNAPGAVVVMHDLLWPCGRRDAYYEPSPLEGLDKHASGHEGPTVWHDHVTPAGFVGLGAYTWSEHAGGERNGVLTAVEDAIRESDDAWRLAVVPAVFGMGVLLRERSEQDSQLLCALRPYTTSRLLASLENNRIALYTRILQLQYDCVGYAENADQMAETIAHLGGEIVQLRAELAQANSVINEDSTIRGIRPSV